MKTFQTSRLWTFCKVIGGTVLTLIVAFALALICIGLSSCNPVKRMGGIAAKHPDAALKLCARMFPATETETIIRDTVTNTIIKPGRDIETIVYTDCDSAVAAAKGKPAKVATAVKAKGADTVIITNLVTNTITKTVIDRKAEKLLQLENNELNADNDKLRKGRNTWRWIGIAGIVLLAGGFVLKLKRIV